MTRQAFLPRCPVYPCLLHSFSPRHSLLPQKSPSRSLFPSFLPLHALCPEVPRDRVGWSHYSSTWSHILVLIFVLTHAPPHTLPYTRNFYAFIPQTARYTRSRTRILMQYLLQLRSLVDTDTIVENGFLNRF